MLHDGLVEALTHAREREQQSEREASERQLAGLHLPEHGMAECLVLLDGKLDMEQHGALDEQPRLAFDALKVRIERAQYARLALSVREQQQLIHERGHLRGLYLGEPRAHLAHELPARRRGQVDVAQYRCERYERRGRPLRAQHGAQRVCDDTIAVLDDRAPVRHRRRRAAVEGCEEREDGREQVEGARRRRQLQRCAEAAEHAVEQCDQRACAECLQLTDRPVSHFFGGCVGGVAAIQQHNDG